MAKVINIERCPHCGQSINEREVTLFDGMIKALFRVWKWCIEKERSHEIKRTDFKHLFQNENEIMRFADLKHFIPDLIYGEKQGYYSFDIKGLGDIFSGKEKMPTRILKNPVTKEVKRLDYENIHNIPKLNQFLTDEKEYIVRYAPSQPGTQPTLF